MDYGAMISATVGLVTLAGVIYGFGRTNGKFDAHATEMREFKKEVTGEFKCLRDEVGEVTKELANTRGQLGLNGH